LTVLVSEAEEIVNAGAASGAAVTTTGASFVVITGETEEFCEMPSIVTAATVKVYDVAEDNPDMLMFPWFPGTTLLVVPVLLSVTR
jgi:hypothetical protein